MTCIRQRLDVYDWSKSSIHDCDNAAIVCISGEAAAVWLPPNKIISSEN
jgi:hypothetical protein